MEDSTKLMVTVLGLALILAVSLGFSVPGCSERDHRHYVQRIEACTQTCGERGVALNQPYYSPPCVCR